MKSKILSLFILLAWCGIALHAEDDPVLMHVNGKEVLRSEFEYLFNKNAAAGARTDAGEVERYVGLFVDLKLKVAAAEAAGGEPRRRAGPAGFSRPPRPAGRKAEGRGGKAAARTGRGRA